MADTWGGSWGVSWATSWTRSTVTPPASGGGGGGGGELRRRADFGVTGKRLRDDEPTKVQHEAKVNAKAQADRMLEEARERALEALREETRRMEAEAAKRQERRERKLAAAAKALEALEAHKALLEDDEEFLTVFVQMMAKM